MKISQCYRFDCHLFWLSLSSLFNACFLGQFLGTVGGRGLYIFVCGLLSMSLLLTGVWQEALSFGAGAFAVVVGIAMMIQGWLSRQRLEAMRAKFESVEAARAAFQRYED